MKIRYSCAGGLLIALILCALLVPASAQAQSQAILRWAEAGKPGTRGNVIARLSEVSEIAIGSGGVFYAIDSANAKVYRSLNAGIAWEDITSRLTIAGAVLPAARIAVAPDNAAIVAAVTNAGTKVCLSTDGGFTWIDTSVPSLAGTIQTIAISKLYTETGNTLREIAIGTADWGDATATTTGQVWVFQFGEFFSSWRNQNIIVDPSHEGGEISAIAYSPNFQLDRTILVIASTASDVVVCQNQTRLCIGKRSTSAGTTSWNTVTGYPVEIGTLASPSAGDAPGVSRIVSSLALPSDYSGNELALERKVFASYDREPDAPSPNDDVYRLDDTTPSRLNANSGAAINIASLAYHGTVASGELLAGDVSRVPGLLTVQVRRTANPFAPSPTWQVASQPPSGPGKAQVSWNSDGTVAYCGTSQSPGDPLVPPDESAFSRSLDGGDTWEQISLIDTSITVLDVAVAPSPKSLFLATASAAGPESVWRSAGEPLGRYWGRVLTMNTTSNRVILRLSPNYRTDYTLYAAEVPDPLGVGGNLIMMSHNRGNSWHQRLAPDAVIDMAVADRDTVYVALSDGRISKSTNGAWFWENPAGTSLPNINMLSIAPKETILVGGKNGEVAYSTDGGASFTQTPTVGTDKVWVVADAGYEENSVIYAGNGNGICRKAIGDGSNWECIRTLSANQRISGLVIADGILYGAWYDTVAGSSGVERCLEPTTLIPEWDTMDIGSEARRFDTTPNSLQVSSTATEVSLWAIDTASPALMVYDDTLAKVRPTLTAPDQVQPDPLSGRNSQFAITWPSVSTCNEYEVEIYADAGCTALVLSAPTVAPAIAYRPSDIANPSWVVGAGQLTSGRDYYVRLRVKNQLSGDQIRGLWSAPVKLTVALGVPVRAPYSGPLLVAPMFGATNAPQKPAFTWGMMLGATEYEFVLAKDAGLIQIVAGTPVRVKSTAWQCPSELDYGTTYFWRVRAITPAASDWSPVASFTTMAKPASPPPAPPPSPPPAPEPLAPSYLLWLMVSISTMLIIGLIVLIVRTGG